MNVIHLVHSDTGGAARAATRINDAINIDSNISSKILVLKKSKSNPYIYLANNSKIGKVKRELGEKVNKKLVNKYNATSLFSYDKVGIDVTKNKLVREADIINIHWVNNGMLSYDSLKKLKTLNKPIVWTLHDMCAFTGGCHYNEDCDKYKKQCGNCPVICSNKNKDLSYKIQQQKASIYRDMNLIIVGCSKWITKCAKESSVLRNKKCINIPNPINISTFKPINKNVARDILNINTNKKIILFGAMSSTSDKRKGYKYLLEVLKRLNKKKYMAIIFGNSSEEDEISKYIETKYMGKITDDYSLSLLYNSADIFIAPSMQENLANTVMESLACGTPVLAFDIGGMRDMIIHRYSGYLASAYNVNELVEGVDFCIKNNIELSKNARDYIVSNFNYDKIGEKYKKLYYNIINNKKDNK